MRSRVAMVILGLCTVAALSRVVLADLEMIEIPNSGFEIRESFDPLPEGFDRYPQWAREDWRYWERSANGGPVRIWNPGPPGTGDVWGSLDEGFGGEAPEGKYAAFVYTRYGDAQNSEDGNYFEAVTQLLTNAFDSTKSYTLTVEVGNPGERPWGGYALYLAAGGTEVNGATYGGYVIGGTIVARDVNTLPVPEETFVTATVTYRPSSQYDALSGEPIQIRLAALEAPLDLGQTMYAVFDNVTLSVGDPPPPTGLMLKVR